MTTHSEQRIVPFRPEQIFALVADVRRYPEFLPWCVGARIRSSREDLIVADLMIGYKLVRERFTSKVTLDRARYRIDTEYTDGPFNYLVNHWVFHEHPEGCRIEFHVDFEFRSAVLQKIVAVLFNEAVRRMVAAFVDRAHAVHGGSGEVALEAPSG